MSNDKIGSRLFSIDGDFTIIPKEKRQIQHEYLNYAEKEGKAKFRYYTSNYMPTVEVRASNGCIVEVNWHACPSKILFNHNLQELQADEIEYMFDVLIADLEYMGIYTTKEILKKKPLNVLDVNKLVLWPNNIDLAFYLQSSAKQGRFTSIISLYPNDGVSVNNTLKHRKLIIYDKSKESEELKYLDKETLKFMKNAAFTLINVEYQMRTKKEIDAEFRTQKISLANTVENAFNPIIAKTILWNRVNEYFKDIFMTSDEYETIKEKVTTYCKKNGKKGCEKITSLIGIAFMAKKPGIKNQLLQFSDRNTVTRKLKELKEIDLTPVKPLEEFKALITNTIETNFPITLDYLKTADKTIKCKGSYAENPHNIDFGNDFPDLGYISIKNI